VIVSCSVVSPSVIVLLLLSLLRIANITEWNHLSR
jgi:hypothetical protein